jgi:Immunity protein 26
MKRLKLKIGDVFSIPITKELMGYGQIVLAGTVQYIVVFEEAYRKEEKVSAERIVSGKILLVGHTTDARLYHGMWKIIGNAPVPKERIPFPCYKRSQDTADNIVVVDFEGNILRSASKEEQQLLSYKPNFAPIRFEKVLQAKHGIGSWDKDYDELTVEYARQRVLGRKIQRKEKGTG